MRKVHVEEEIAAAISLYLDIINLFLAYVFFPLFKDVTNFKFLF
jgi:FtsH-binding integral membrane protein